MIGILKLNIDLQLITTQDEVDRIVKNVEEIVAENCFTKLHRRVLKAEIVDIELTDQDIDVIKMLDTRLNGEKSPVTKEPK